MLGQLVMAARGQKDAFTITGTEHPTRDGTGIRDYIHVWDLARAHVRGGRAVRRGARGGGRAERDHQRRHRRGCHRARAGRGVREGLRQEGAGRARRRRGPGDAVGAFANVDKARELLGWSSSLSLDDAIASALAWGEKRQSVLGYE